MNTAVKTGLFTIFALVAFAANSVLSRLALGSGALDAASFTAIRLLSGIVALVVIIGVRHRGIGWVKTNNNWWQGSMLFLYAVCFSYAYRSLDTGVGALILFGAVQITMITASFLSGVRLRLVEWIGMLIAFSGFAYLMLPGASAPPLVGASFMLVSGIAWGLYTLAGRGSQEPLRDTGLNFLATLPFVILLAGVSFSGAHLSAHGVLYAVLSGALASGCGYALWYAALPQISAVLAGVLQLSVPVIAAAGGIAFMSEAIHMRLVLSSLLILGGIFIVVVGRHMLTRRSAKLLSTDI